jgi:hypothetical protein
VRRYIEGYLRTYLGRHILDNGWPRKILLGLILRFEDLLVVLLLLSLFACLHMIIGGNQWDLISCSAPECVSDHLNILQFGSDLGGSVLGCLAD